MGIVPAQENGDIMTNPRVGHHVMIQQGAEKYAGLWEKPDDPWEDETTWKRVLAAPKHVVPNSAVAGMNQVAIFFQLGLIKEEEVVTDAYTWQGIPEMPGYVLFHAKGRYAWFMVLEDQIFHDAVRDGTIVHQGPLGPKGAHA